MIYYLRMDLPANAPHALVTAVTELVRSFLVLLILNSVLEEIFLTGPWSYREDAVTLVSSHTLLII